MQSVMCLTTVVCLTADPGVVGSISALSHTFVEIDHEIIFIFILLSTHNLSFTGPHSAVGNVSDYSCVSDCRSRGCGFDLGPVPYFCRD